jgi:epsilon-lactone hydrolase
MDRQITTPKIQGRRRLGHAIATAVILSFAASVTARPAPLDTSSATGDLRAFIPLSVSPQAKAIYERLLPVVKAKKWDRHDNPHTIAEFDAVHDADLQATVSGSATLIKSLNLAVVDKTVNGVPVVETTTIPYRDDGTVLIHVHGGGFYLGSARSSMWADAEMAVTTGKRIISVDYTVAPHGRWPLVTSQVIAVYKAFLERGYAPKSIGMFGDSAGGNIVAASTLKLRDEGLPLPGALILMSPCTDFLQIGDTNTTLRKVDPAIDEIDIAPGFEAYADRQDWRNPYVSPVYGDFHKGYPPTLIQGGTKEVLLSDFVRLYQAIKTAGGTAELDIYEGMAHSFQAYMTNAPEQKAALAEAGKFWDAHLAAKK